MKTFFLQLFNMSITAGWLVLAVLLLRLLFRRAPRWLSVVLWGFVAVRLVCPFSFESIFSVIPSRETVPPAVLTSPVPEIESGIPVINDVVNPFVSEHLAPSGTVSVSPMELLVNVSSIVWLFGAAALLLYTVVSAFLLHRKLRESVRLEGNVFLCDRITAPFLFGVFRPRIFLPSAMEERDRFYVVAHEQAHRKRLDYLWKPLGFLLLSVYWFNPLLWVGYFFFCRDIELACDEKVVHDFDTRDKKAYSQALIDYSMPRRVIAAYPLAFGEIGVKQRIKSVLHYKRPVLWLTFAAGAAVAVVAVLFLTDPLGNAQRLDLTGEEAHAYCETYAEETGWLQWENTDVGYIGPRELSEVVEELVADESGAKLIALYEISSADTYDGSTVLKLKINKVYYGDTSFEEREVKVTVPAESAKSCVGKWYVGLLNCEREIASYSDPYWTFFVTEDDYLVNGWGCLKEYEDSMTTSFVPAWFGSVCYTGQPLDVFVKDVENYAEEAKNEATEKVNTPEVTISAQPTLEDGIREALLEREYRGVPDDTQHFVSYRILEQERTATTATATGELQEVVVYLLSAHTAYNIEKNFVEEQFGSAGPKALTFSVDHTGSYLLEEFWEPRDGAFYAKDVKRKFPDHVADKVFGQSYEPLLDECDDQALSLLAENQRTEKIASLRRKYPAYFDLPTTKGLELYVWQITDGYCSFGLLPGRNLAYTDEELNDLPGASLEEMQLIVSTYNLQKSMVTVIPFRKPQHTWVPEPDDAFRETVEALFWGE